MGARFKCLFKFEVIIIILIFISFSLLWINWGKLHVSGWDLPNLYKKMTKTTNIIFFFNKKESVYLAYVFYIVPLLALFSSVFLFALKRKTANVFLLLSCFMGVVTSFYMYNYFWSSKIFKLSNAGVGIHLLCSICIVGVFYSYRCIRKINKKALIEPVLSEEDETA